MNGLNLVDLTSRPTAYCKRAALSQQLTRSCTELLFDRALKKAQDLDQHLAETGRVVGPLHGIPVSVKDCVNIEGYTSTIGLAGWATKLATSNSVIFDILEKQGAVIHVKTNVPQSMMVSMINSRTFSRLLCS